MSRRQLVWRSAPLRARKRSSISGLAEIATAGLGLLALAACAVGPDFAPPTVPPQAGYTPENAPATTASAPLDAGAAQRVAVGRDTPGDWWTVFHSKELDALIAEALQSNPSLQAAQATLWQAKENLYAQAGVMVPNLDLNSSATRQQ